MGHRLVTEPLFNYSPPMRGQMALATDTEDEMEAKHTPGPWRIDPTTADTDTCILVVDVQDVTVATIWKQPLDPPEWAEANAALIAAAPDLLDACKRALRVLDCEPANATYKAHRDIVAGAIARAEGRES